jgi:hypothetical protein
MIQTINFYNFQNAFDSIRPDNFSYHGLRALFDYIEELEDDISEQLELDVIAISCDWTEWESLEDYQEQYSAESMEDIEDITTVIYIDGTDSFITLAH